MRQIAAAAGISKSTLYSWITGPLQEELERSLAESPRKQTGSFTEIDGKSAVRETEGLGRVPVSEDQGDHEQRGERPGQGPEHSLQVADPFPEHHFGGVLESLGKPDPPATFHDIDIQRSYNAVICGTCGKPSITCDQRDFRFGRCEDGKMRPICDDCRRAGSGPYFPWPDPPGSVRNVPRRHG